MVRTEPSPVAVCEARPVMRKLVTRRRVARGDDRSHDESYRATHCAACKVTIQNTLRLCPIYGVEAVLERRKKHRLEAVLDPPVR